MEPAEESDGFHNLAFDDLLGATLKSFLILFELKDGEKVMVGV